MDEDRLTPEREKEIAAMPGHPAHVWELLHEIAHLRLELMAAKKSEIVFRDEMVSAALSIQNMLLDPLMGARE